MEKDAIEALGSHALGQSLAFLQGRPGPVRPGQVFWGRPSLSARGRTSAEDVFQDVPAVRGNRDREGSPRQRKRLRRQAGRFRRREVPLRFKQWPRREQEGTLTPARSLPDALVLSTFLKTVCQKRLHRQPPHVTLEVHPADNSVTTRGPLLIKPTQLPPPEAPVLGSRPQCSCFLVRMRARPPQGTFQSSRCQSSLPPDFRYFQHQHWSKFLTIGTTVSSLTAGCLQNTKLLGKVRWSQSPSHLTWGRGCPPPHTSSRTPIPPPCLLAQDQPFRVPSISPRL